MLAISEFFENTWQSVTYSGSNNSVLSQLPTTAASITMSNFGPAGSGVFGVTTTQTINGVASPLPVLVMADYSLWCPILGAYVSPEQTNFKIKTEE